MNTQVAFRHMETSPALRDYATKKLKHVVGKYVSGPVDASVVLDVQKIWHIADFTVNIKNLTVKAEERSEDMYSSIDVALGRLEKQLRRHKDRLRDHKPSNGQPRSFKMGVVAPFEPEQDFETEEETEPIELAAAAEAEAVSPAEILRLTELEAKSLSLEEAVIQLDLLTDREFYVYNDSESGRIHVVFRRKDGNIGLIQT